MTRGSEHFTITEAHPFHGPDNVEAYNEQCPKCRASRRGVASELTRCELRELEPGQRFMFYADDLAERGPCTLVSKGEGGAIIMYEPHDVTKTFKARAKNGEIIEKTITQHLSGESRCALGAQVVPLPAEPKQNAFPLWGGDGPGQVCG